MNWRREKAGTIEHVTMNGEDAPQLKNVSLRGEQAERALEEILDALDTMLDYRVVHGDLFAFNILFDGERPVIIDFPQCGVCSVRDAAGKAEDLWTRHYRLAPGLAR